ncbi:MAG: sterol desaturase family protein [Pseudomonadota bacterium]
MDGFIAEYETALRFSVFAAAFVLFSALEALFPRRGRLASRTTRWVTNGAMLALASLLVRGLVLIAPLLAMGAAAALAIEMGWGLFNLIALPVWLEVVLAIILLDFAIWFQHWATHRIGPLWRLHRVHHADRDIDASTALRFHPIEIALSAVWKLLLVMTLGPAIVAAILFEIILNASALFNHANLALPRWLDRTLRTVVVTPDMHRVHHSTDYEEHNANYGFCLSIWDRLFRTYRAEPGAGHRDMVIGLPGTGDGPSDRLGWSLTYPFRR